MEEERKENETRCGEERKGGTPENGVCSASDPASLRSMIREKWEKVLLSDRRKLASLRKRVLEDLEKNSSSPSLEKFLLLLDKFSAKFLGEKADSLRVLFPENLPISA
ncbi:MAG: hypothetical protein J6A21_01680 [Lentisphaeria bacterium]|nr:hypothetical protein [Lentisphaeria bacterium]